MLSDTTPKGNSYVLLRSVAPGPAPTLMLLASTGVDTLTVEPYCCVGQALHARGWNIVSLDLPCHGPQQPPGIPPQLKGWAALIAKSENIVAPFTDRVADVLDHLVQTNVADQARLAIAGTSRGGFLAFHCAAVYPALRAAAAFGPVTDLIALTEFAGQQQNPLVERLAMKNLAPALKNRSIWITIGNADMRVDTDKAIAFTRALTAASLQAQTPSDVTLRLMPTPGHQSFPAWHLDAAQWLASTVN